MDIGIPGEARPREHRVALAPSGVRTLVQLGHRVWVESDAGKDAGHPNSTYESAGARIAYSREEVLGRAKLIATVYAPLARDYVSKGTSGSGSPGLPLDGEAGRGRCPQMP